MARQLPTKEEALRILARKRTRPPIRPAPPAGRALNRFVKDLDAKYGQGSGALTARWREVVGPEIARRTEPVKLVRGRNGDRLRWRSGWRGLPPRSSSTRPTTSSPG